MISLQYREKYRYIALLVLCILCSGCNVSFNKLEDANEIRERTNQIIYFIKHSRQIRNTLFIMKLEKIVKEQQNEAIIYDKIKKISYLQRELPPTRMFANYREGTSKGTQKRIIEYVS